MLGCAILAAIAAAFAPERVYAHFILVTPDAWMSQDAFGLPEKLGPCGNEGGGTPTGKVTAFQPGETIMVTINEVVPHPGHYRVALSLNDRSELPPEPVVTPTADDPCGSVGIQSPPIFPILADNMLPHTQAFAEPQTFAVTLPNDVTCTKCTLQVLEFMSSHGAPCFYHHCADISIQGALEIASPTPSPTSTDTPTSTPAQTATSIPPASATPVPTNTPSRCVGDCDGSGSVTVDEAITLVNIALGNALPSSCPAGVPSGAAVNIALIIQAVNNALGGCGG